MKQRSYIHPALLGLVTVAALGCGSTRGDVDRRDGETAPTPELPAPPSVPWTRPENCVSSYDHQSAGGCQVNLRCGSNEDVVISCVESDGIWTCDCSYPSFSGRYEVRDVNAESACAATLEFCMAGPTQFTGPEVCEPVALPSGSDYCQQQAICTRDVDVGDGVSAALQTRSMFERCDNYGQPPGAPPVDALDCRCVSTVGFENGTAANASIDVSVHGASLDTACDVMHELCGDAATVFPGEPSCVPSQTTSPGYCQTEVPCTRSRSLPDGVTAEYVETQTASCGEAPEGGVSSCLCSGSTLDARRVNFVVDAPTDGLDNCDLALSICASEASVTLNGSSQCAATMQSADDKHCDANFTCTLPGRVDGQSLELEGYLTTRCTIDGENSWNCRCISGSLTTDFTLGATDASAACASAASSCQDRQVIEVGTLGNSVF